MTSLTRVAISARKAIRYTIFAIIFLIVGKFLLDGAIAIYLNMFPPGPPPPTVTFGKLTKIPFPEKGAKPTLTFTLETPEGGFPDDITTQAKVFFMPKPSSNLLALDVAKEKARALGFTSGPEQVSDTIYKFSSPTHPASFETNIVSGTFSISYDLSADGSPIATRPPAAEVAASLFRSALSSANLLPEDLNGPMTHSFFKLSSGALAPAISLSESDVIKINLFRKNYDDIPVVTSNPNESNVWAMLSGATTREQQIIAAEYHYFPIDETQFATYPIITPEEAYNQLQSEKVYIADMGLVKDNSSVTIRRIYVAYFDPEIEADFFQPVYVFEGDNGFVAYIPAVSPTYYGQ